MQTMEVKINRNTKLAGELPAAVRRAAGHLKRDIESVFCETEAPGCQIVLTRKELPQEQYRIAVREGKIEIQAADELGFIYGIYAVSKNMLGVHEFWFWNDQEFARKEEICIPEDYILTSEPFRVKYRGWFVNDEVLLHTWSVGREKEKPWEMAFEALLRCGGNMVIPGTDKNSKMYTKLAGEMGLWVTHHHAEPLGAEMFARAYPQLTASYDLYPDKFHGLWQDAVDAQRGRKIIWNLGFRGQGDRPFWDEDDRYRTDEARGKLMSGLIRKQYDMVKAADADAVCSTNLYGETMELYQKGCLTLPEDVIKIWADNGYGKMVSRRQGNQNPRVCSLPERKEDANGIYYHASFYDLQAANHMTMLPNPPEFIKKELTEVLDRGGDDFWIVNCSNVKPHVYTLDFLAQLWKTGEIDIESHRREYIEKYYGMRGSVSVAERLKEYPDYAVSYGTHEDEHAGEQFTNHVPRMLVNQYMRNHEESCKELLWAINCDTLEGQVRWYREICEKGMASYREYLGKCELTDAELTDRAKTLFEDSILLQAQIHAYCFRGAYEVCKSLEEAFAGNYQRAFYFAGKARKEYLKADSAMRAREHGKWHDFYRNECLADIKQTAWVLEGFMSYVRALGDGPHYYEWQREYLYAEKDRRVMLILNMENHLRDEELFSLMEAALD